MSLVVTDPKSVVIRDVAGDQQGANYWVGLRELMEEINDGFWGRMPWSRHNCTICRRDLHVNGEWRSLKAAVIDGITNTRGPACAVHECPFDLPNIDRTR